MIKRHYKKIFQLFTLVWIVYTIGFMIVPTNAQQTQFITEEDWLLCSTTRTITVPIKDENAAFSETVRLSYAPGAPECTSNGHGYTKIEATGNNTDITFTLSFLALIPDTHIVVFAQTGNRLAAIDQVTPFPYPAIVTIPSTYELKGFAIITGGFDYTAFPVGVLNLNVINQPQDVVSPLEHGGVGPRPETCDQFVNFFKSWCKAMEAVGIDELMGSAFITLSLAMGFMGLGAASQKTIIFVASGLAGVWLGFYGTALPFIAVVMITVFALVAILWPKGDN